MTVFIDWIVVGNGWMFIILSINVLFLVGVAIFAYEINLRVMRVELKYHGLKDKVFGFISQLDVTNKNIRRVTDSFDEVVSEELKQAETRIKKRVKPKTPDDDQE